MDAPKQMLEQRFLDHIYEGYMAGQRYCFILGAGASRTSGIRTGEELMREWRDFLIGKGKEYVSDCARELKIKPERYEHLLDRDAPLRNDDYFTLFDLRYAGNSSAAYAFLEREMEKKFPSYGYFPLAMLLAHTENRLVITTNFDSLVEDALYAYTSIHPLAVGHESLAPYIENVTRRPVIAKVHRDLLLRPMNREEEMEKLAEEWEGPLSRALQKYIPIVIGYAGGDHTLMSLLQKLKLRGLYWCHVGEMKEPAIRDLVAQQKGYLVKILGFDEIMFQLGQRFEEVTQIEDAEDYVRRQAEERCKRYQESLDAIRRKYDTGKQESAQPAEVRQDPEELKGIVKAIDSYDARQEGDEENPGRDYAVGARIAALTGDYPKAEELFSQAIALAPNTAEYYNGRSATLHAMGRYPEALEDADKAIELEPDHAGYYHSRAATLHAMGRYPESVRDRGKAIELDPDNPRYYEQRGVTLHEMGQYKKALEDKTRAIQLEPDNARYWEQRGVTLETMNQYEQALADKTKAIELGPDHADYYISRSITLYKMKHYKDALADQTKAIELDPDNGEYYKLRGVTLHEMGQYTQALADKTKAVELEPDNARYWEQRGVTLEAMGRYPEALKDETRAIQLKPNHADYYISRSMILKNIGQYEQALEDVNMAIRLDDGNASYYRARAEIFEALGRQEEAWNDEKRAKQLEKKEKAGSGATQKNS